MVSGARRNALVVVEGPIGVGKTALATQLAEALDGETLLDQPAANPFLARACQGQPGNALPAQLCFLFERVRLLEGLRQDSLFTQLRVADFLFAKDRLFAELTLDAAEAALYEQVHASVAVEAPAADLVVYLQAPVDVLRDRLAQRSDALSRSVSREHLERVASAYARFFHSYTESPLLIVNVGTFDPAYNTRDFLALRDEIAAGPRGRRFFNPVAANIA